MRRPEGARQPAAAGPFRSARGVVVGAVVVALAVVGLAGCTDPTPEPDDAAAALARGVAARDLTGVVLDVPDVDATAELRTAFDGLPEAEVTVEIAAISEISEGSETSELVTEGGDPDAPTVDATLAYSWDLGVAEPWTYTTTATLDLVDDVWVPRWSSFLLAPDLRSTETLSLRRVPAERGTILGGGGAEVLVEPRPVVRLGVDKTRVEAAQLDAAARAVAAVTGVDAEAYAQQVAAAGPKAFVEAITVRAESTDVDRAAFEALPGALAVEDTLPLAPSRRFARPVLGAAGPATAEIVAESDGAVVAGDLAGLSGLQRQYDAQLRGTPGVQVVATASDNGQERVLFDVAPVAGTPLVTRLLSPLQDAAEDVLADVGPASAVVALRASTGEVLAAASGPGGDGFSTAMLGGYPPGSTFKVVSTLALLRAGLTPDSEVQCPPTLPVDGRVFENVPGYPATATGPISLRTAVANSCNTAFLGARDLVSQQDLADAAASLGLGVEADVGFPTMVGEVPVDGGATDHAASMIGQGRVVASPLAMATVVASVAAGERVVPWLVGTEPPAGERPPLTSEEQAALRDVLRAVVTDGGGAFLVDVPGEPVLAKTGTAQFAAGDGTANHAWVVAVQGDLAVCVFVAEGESGARTAGPLLAEFLALAQAG